MKKKTRIAALLTALLMCFTFCPVPAALAEDTVELTPFFWGYETEEVNDPIRLGDEFDLSLGWTVNGQLDSYDCGEITRVSLKKAGENSYITLYDHGQVYSSGEADPEEGAHFLLHLRLSVYMDPGEYQTQLVSEKGTFLSGTSQTFLPPEANGPGGEFYPLGFAIEPYFFCEDVVGSEIPIGKRFDLSVDLDGHADEVTAIELVSADAPVREYRLYENGTVNYGGKIDNAEEGPGYMTGFSSADFEPGAYFLKIVTATDADGTPEPVVTFTGNGTNQNGPVIDAAAPPEAKEGEAYAFTLKATPRNGGAITWSVASGALPQGLSLNAKTGVISGTPAAEGTYTFTVKAQEAGGDSAAAAFSLTVKGTAKHTVSFLLNGGKAAAGADYSARRITEGESVVLPAAPSKTRCRFVYWELGGDYYLPGAEVAVKTDLICKAVYTDTEPLQVTLPKGFESAYGLYLYGVRANGTKSRLWTQSAEGAPDVRIPAPSLRYTTFTGLELYGCVDNQETLLASFSGAVTQETESVTLVSAGVKWQTVRGVRVKGLTEGIDYTVSNQRIHLNGADFYVRFPVMLTEDREVTVTLRRIPDSGAAAEYVLQAEYKTAPGADGYLTVEPIPLSRGAEVSVSAELDGSVYNGTVLASQTVNGVTRTVSDRSSKGRPATLRLYAGIPARFSLTEYAGTDIYVFEGETLADPEKGAAHTVRGRIVTLDARISFAADAEPEAARRYITALSRSGLYMTVTQKDAPDKACRKAVRIGGLMPDLTLRDAVQTYGISPDAAVTASFSSAFTREAEADAKLTDGAGGVSLRAKLKPGAVVRLQGSNTAKCFLAWFDGQGSYIGRGETFLLGYAGHDVASVCPAERAGRYTLALLPTFYGSEAYLRAHTLASLSDGPILASWPLTLTDTGVTALAPYTADAVTSENIWFATKPYSTLQANRESFGSVSDILCFSGSVGIDPGLENGKLRQLCFNAFANGPCVYMNGAVIDGVSYPPSAWEIFNGYHRLVLEEPVELPCAYTIYATPADTSRGVRVSLYADVGYNDGEYASGQLIGSAEVVRPGASVSAFSTYVCEDTVLVTGTAKRNEKVKIYDNGTLVSEVSGNDVKAGWDGVWSASVTLAGTDDTYTTVHTLQAVSGSGVVSEPLTVIHRRNGPQLKALNLIINGEEHTETAYYVSTIRAATAYRAVFANPEQLEEMPEWDARAVIKVCYGSGDIVYVSAAQQEDGSFIAELPSRYDYIDLAEVLYLPKNGEEQVSEQNDGSLLFLPTAKEAAEYENEIAALRENLTVDRKGKTALRDPAGGQGLRITFDKNGGATASGGMAAAASEDKTKALEAAFGSTGKEFEADDVRFTELSLGMNSGKNLFEWLNAAGDARTAANKAAGADAKGSVSQRTQVFSDKKTFESTRELFARYATDPAYSRFAEDDNHVQFRYGASSVSDIYTLSDCEYEGTGDCISGTYSVTAVLTADTGKTPAVYTASVTAKFASDFKGYTGLKKQNGARKSRGVLSLLVPRANAETADDIFSFYNGDFRDDPAYEQSSTLETLSGDATNATGFFSGMIGTTSNVSRFMGGVGGGLGVLNLGATGYNLFKTYGNADYRIQTRVQMERDFDNLVSSPCYKRLPQGKKELVDEAVSKFQKAQKAEDGWDGWYTGLGLGLDAVGMITGTIGSDPAMMEFAAAGLVFTGLSAANGATLGRAMNKARDKAIRQYNESYRTIKKIFQSHANQIGLNDCKQVKKDESNNKKYNIHHDPSGVVYEGVIENPVEGAAVTLWYAVDADGLPVPEKDAKNVKQVIPAADVTTKTPAETVQVTGPDGKYQWFVPQGLWYVTAEKAGLSGDSNADRAATVKVKNVKAAGKSVANLLPVLPPQLDVNIPLVDQTAPTVENVRYTDEGIFVTFSKYMVDPEKGAESVLNAANYTLKTAAGNVAIAGAKAVEQGHTPANIDGEAGKTYTKTVLLTPKTALKAGTQVLLTVNKRVKSYAGVSMTADHADSGVLEAQKTPGTPVIAGGKTQTVAYGSGVTISLPKNAPAGTVIYYTTDGSAPTKESKRYEGPFPATNKMTVKAIAVCPGYKDSAAVSAAFVISEAQQYCPAGEVRIDGKPAPAGLTLTLSDGKYKATIKTAADGSYMFHDVPVGDYTLSFAGNDACRPASIKIQITTFDPWVNLELTDIRKTPDYTPGDADGDGSVSASDARLALRRAVGLETFPEGGAQFLACDADKDGSVTAADARLILRRAVGFTDPEFK